MLAMTPVQCRQNTSAMLANASTAPAGPLKANSTTTLVQHQQQGQLDAGNDVSAMQASNAKKTPLLPWPDHQRPKLLWADSGYINKATGNDIERNNSTSPTMGFNCIMTGQMPACDAGGNAGVPRVATPAQQGQRRPCNEGNDAGTMSATTTA